jgi:Lung seven transmembrane receptor
MCLYYSLLAIFWTIVSSLYWRQLLRIQFWVGAVILLGMMEKAMFYFEYNQANTNGYSSMPLALSAELVGIPHTVQPTQCQFHTSRYPVLNAH